MNQPTHEPRLVWKGKIDTEVFRIVDRGTPRPDKPRDRRFALEQSHGRDAMGATSWREVNPGARLQALRVLTAVLGGFLVNSPKDFAPHHPLCCEINTAIAEDRVARGCDCGQLGQPTNQ